jgi:hypothetical protein
MHPQDHPRSDSRCRPALSGLISFPRVQHTMEIQQTVGLSCPVDTPCRVVRQPTRQPEVSVTLKAALQAFAREA